MGEFQFPRDLQFGRPVFFFGFCLFVLLFFFLICFPIFADNGLDPSQEILGLPLGLLRLFGERLGKAFLFDLVECSLRLFLDFIQLELQVDS